MSPSTMMFRPLKAKKELSEEEVYEQLREDAVKSLDSIIEGLIVGDFYVMSEPALAALINNVFYTYTAEITNGVQNIESATDGKEFEEFLFRMFNKHFKTSVLIGLLPGEHPLTTYPDNRPDKVARYGDEPLLVSYGFRLFRLHILTFCLFTMSGNKLWDEAFDKKSNLTPTQLGSLKRILTVSAKLHEAAVASYASD